MSHTIYGLDFGVSGPTVLITTTPSEDDTRRVMRLGWSAAIVLPAAPGYEIPEDEAWEIHNWIAKRRTFQERQARIHALWMLGWRGEAQRIYWQAKLKRKVKR